MNGMSSRYFDYDDPMPYETKGEARLLADLPDQDWVKLARYSETRRYAPGSSIVEAGARDQSLYFLLNGVVGAVLPHESVHFKEIDAPSVLGEVSFIDGGPRSVRLVALSECELLRLSIDSFQVMAAYEPELGRAVLTSIAQILAMRLRAATKLLESQRGG
ncbi:Crp/Fnr family transcriptional regulator [Streptomyces sp. NPDC056519]|uniref:Crp/Fnr family transcriptional regulator n=1 Tax=Streptomyces sp. NPDC056519 TaxID=3345849 RepID=UPI00368B732D